MCWFALERVRERFGQGGEGFVREEWCRVAVGELDEERAGRKNIMSFDIFVGEAGMCCFARFFFGGGGRG